jgi:Flp pilus assembly protein TadD
MLAALGYEEQLAGKTAKAKASYQRALALDPNLVDAASNLGVIEAQTGNLQFAAKLLQGAFERAPGRSSIGMNLARVFCLSGKLQDAHSTTLRVLEFNPDLNAAKDLLKNLTSSKPGCESN